jgi:hypothetical protein
MMKATLLTLLSVLLLPSAFANGVERGHEAEVPAPVFTPLMQQFIAQEVERRCDFSDTLGSLALAGIRPQSVNYAGDRLIYRAMVTVGTAAGQEDLNVTAAQEIGAATPRILDIASPRCARD